MKKILPKHFTSSMYVTSLIDGQVKVLLHMHDKLEIWLGVGGHIEENENPLQAALREAKEETGMDVELIANRHLIRSKDVTEIPKPVFVLEEHIPGKNGMHEHIHIDFIYFGYLKDYENVKMKEEYRFCTKEDLNNMKLQFEVATIAPRAIDAGRQYIGG